MPAGQQLRVLVRAQERDRLVDRSRPRVVERRGDHAAPPLASRIARQTFSGLAGRSICVTPIGVNASTTAFSTAGGDAIVPVSPTPLIPSSFVVEGVTLPMLAVIDGTSGAPGIP